MAFTFVHTADWQLGKPFRNLGSRVATLLEQARLETIDRIAAVAATAGARHVLVAGDVFDTVLPSDRTLLTALDRLRKAEQVVWHLLPGNHDHTRPGGLWERMATHGLPVNVRCHLVPEPVEIEADVVLLPAPLTTRMQSTDPTAWFDTAPTARGIVRLGLAHGSIRDFTSGGDAAAVIDPARSRHARLDYLALGDWHGTRQIDTRTWYAGTPEPDRFPDNEPGHVLVVTVDAAGRQPRVERVATAAYTWLRKRARVSDAADLGPLERELMKATPQLDRLLLKLTFDGTVAATDRDAIEAWAREFGERVCVLDVELPEIGSTLSDADLAALGVGDDVRTAARRLRALADGADAEAAGTAKAALGWLARLTRSGGESA